MYKIIRPILFGLDPEFAHYCALSALRISPNSLFSKPKSMGKTIRALGLDFSHRIGLAAGLDKNGMYLDALAKLGFSFIEVGTVTPKPQEGNSKPRLFRLPEAQAIINRMGFNNDGIDTLLANIKRANYQGILGINIGKNKETPLEHAVEDYLFCLRKVYEHASYVTINISSPNTPDLRELQIGEYFSVLMNQLREEQLQLADIYQRYVPLVIKISPDESRDTLKRMADTIVSLGLDGIIATNTTQSRVGVEELRYGHEIGGLSGRPLRSKATDTLRIIKQIVGEAVTLIGVGGIDSVEAATEKLDSGATLLQVYTGLIYQGPSLVRHLASSV